MKSFLDNEVARMLEPARTVRLGPYALVLRPGMHTAGWSKLFWRVWRYSEADERRSLETHASVYGLGLRPGEPVAELRERLHSYIREIPGRSASRYPFGGGAA